MTDSVVSAAHAMSMVIALAMCAATADVWMRLHATTARKMAGKQTLTGKTLVQCKLFSNLQAVSSNAPTCRGDVGRLVLAVGKQQIVICGSSRDTVYCRGPTPSERKRKVTDGGC